jgi:lysophospholipase L1-like esterase
MFFRSAIVVGLCAVAAFAADEKNATYLALGDSIAFGFDPNKLGSTADKFTGYPELLSQSGLKQAKTLVNISCPGETTGSFLSLGAPVPPDNCPNYKLFLDLHTDYANGLQADEMKFVLQIARNLELVTIDIGANDLIILQTRCLNNPVCIATGLQATLTTYARNLATILRTIRGAGYTGPIVLLTLYSPNYTDPVQTGAIAALNTVAAGVAIPFRTAIADGFGAFLAASLPAGGNTCAAGLLIVKQLDGTCDVHPTPKGAALLANAVVNAINRAR